MEARHWIIMITELRRFPQMSYKSDIIVLSGVDSGDRAAIDARFKNTDAPCQLDSEDGRFVLKGPVFNPMDVLNTLTEQRGYKVEYNPQQHGIPLKQGNLDDKFAMIYHLSKPSKKKGAPIAEPSPTTLPTTSTSKQLDKLNLDEVDSK